MVRRTIVEVEVEGPGAVVVTLDCGHRRHVRHRPPFEVHPWVLDARQRAARVGAEIECGRCEAAAPG